MEKERYTQLGKDKRGRTVLVCLEGSTLTVVKGTSFLFIDLDKDFS